MRAMLNLPGFQTTGAVVAEVENTSTWKSGKDRDGRDLTKWACDPHVTLQFADCDRATSFDFTFGNEFEHENNLHKVDTMITALTKFRSGLALEQERYMDRLVLVGEDDE